MHTVGFSVKQTDLKTFANVRRFRRIINEMIPTHINENANVFRDYLSSE